MPFGILDVLGNRLSIYFGQSAETTDFIMDCLELWWQENQTLYSKIEELAIDLDNAGLSVVIELNSLNVWWNFHIRPI